MHASALEHARLFFNTYLPKADGLTVIDIGAQDVNGSLRSVAPQGVNYVGVDFVEGRGVDVILTDPYTLPFETGSVDVCVCSSVFEHSEFFWELFLEVMRVLKPEGLLYLNVPSNGTFHRFPVDCWRFYPDSGRALQNWARRKGMQVVALESFMGRQGLAPWNDFVGVFLRDESQLSRYPKRIQHSFSGYTNGLVHGQDDFSNKQEFQQDQAYNLPLRITRSLWSIAYKVYACLPGSLKSAAKNVDQLRP